jgi:GxxExxY protein
MIDLQSDPLTEKIIGYAIAVHRQLGPGLLESIYESALRVEHEFNGLGCERQSAFPLDYRERLIGEFRLELIVEHAVVLELESVERMDPVFDAQFLTYLRRTGIKRGLLINFNSRLLKDGIKRLVL